MEKNYNGWNDSKTRSSGIPESNSEDMSFRKMITGLFDTSFMTASELDTIVKAGEMYAAAKVRIFQAEGMAGEETQEQERAQDMMWNDVKNIFTNYSYTQWYGENEKVTRVKKEAFADLRTRFNLTRKK